MPVAREAVTRGEIVLDRVATLTPQCWMQLCVLRSVEAYPDKQIASMWGVSESTVRQLRTKLGQLPTETLTTVAVEQFRAQLAGYVDAVQPVLIEYGRDYVASPWAEPDD